MTHDPVVKTLVIAEAGVNHNGNLSNALKMVDAAKYCGADIVKFQVFKSASLATSDADKATYQKSTINDKVSQQAMLASLELTHQEFLTIKEYCDKKNIEFLATAFDSESLAFLVNQAGIKRLKIPSGEITNLPFILEHARTGLPLIISTGMASYDEIDHALSTVAFAMIFPDKVPQNLDDLKQARAAADPLLLSKRVTILQCTTAYPTPEQDVNLRVIKDLAERFGCPTGFSDHTAGILAAPLAVALGAAVIEKHFTLDRHMPGPDHSASLEPDELKSMIEQIRSTEMMLGGDQKSVSDEETKNLAVARKSVVAAHSIKSGEMFTAENLICKRPGTGLPPEKYWELLGKKADRDYQPDELIK